jgi:hypothetical protein
MLWVKNHAGFVLSFVLMINLVFVTHRYAWMKIHLEGRIKALMAQIAAMGCEHRAEKMKGTRK